MSKIISSYLLGSRDSVKFLRQRGTPVCTYMHEYFMSTAFALVPILRYVAFYRHECSALFDRSKRLRIKMVDKLDLRSNLPSSR